MRVILRGKTNGLSLRDSDIFLAISIDPYLDPNVIPDIETEGPQFIEICKFLSRTFRTVTLLVADGVQTHNLIADGLSPEKARQVALEKGTQWIDRNDPKSHITNLTGILRWDDIVSRDAFLEQHNLFLQMANPLSERCDEKFIKTVKETEDEFVRRRRTNAKVKFIETASRKAAHDVTIEEAAAVVSLNKSRDLNKTFIVYRGKLPPAMVYALQRFVHATDKYHLLNLDVKIEHTLEKIDDEAIQRQEAIRTNSAAALLLQSQSIFQRQSRAGRSNTDAETSIQKYTSVLADSIAQQVAAVTSMANVELGYDEVLHDLVMKLSRRINSTPLQIMALNSVESNYSPPKASS